MLKRLPRFFPRNCFAKPRVRQVYEGMCHNLRTFVFLLLCATFAGSLFTCFAHLLRLLLANFAHFVVTDGVVAAAAADFIGAILNVNSLKALLLMALLLFICARCSLLISSHT